jgi:hypothetical protein
LISNLPGAVLAVLLTYEGKLLRHGQWSLSEMENSEASEPEPKQSELPLENRPLGSQNTSVLSCNHSHGESLDGLTLKLAVDATPVISTFPIREAAHATSNAKTAHP